MEKQPEIPQVTSIDSSQEPILPRHGWKNQLVFIRVVWQVKQKLDRLEQE